MTDKTQRKWDHRFLELAKHVSTWSKDPSTKVGAVIADDRRIVLGMGYNGFPRGVDDSPERYEDRSIKYQLVVHAEANAILNASRPVVGATIYVLASPCARCASLIVQAGIARVVQLPDVPTFAERWADEIALALKVFSEAGVVHEVYDPRVISAG